MSAHRCLERGGRSLEVGNLHRMVMTQICFALSVFNFEIKLLRLQLLKSGSFSNIHVLQVVVKILRLRVRDQELLLTFLS